MPRRERLYWSAVGVLVTLVVPTLGLLIGRVLFPDSRFTNVPLHSLVEATGGLMAIAIAGILAVERGRRESTEHYAWMAAALFGMGILDTFHAGVELGLTFVWLHSLATLVGGVLFAMVWWRPAWLGCATGFRPIWMSVVGAVVVGALSCAFPMLLPRMIVQGHFTAVASFLNGAGGIGFLAAGIFFVRRYQGSGKQEDWLFAVNTILFGSAGLLFEWSAMWDVAWWWWHLLRLGAYTAALTFALRAYLDAERELLSFNRRLSSLNASLDATIAERTSKLRSSEERFALAVQGSSDGLWDWNVLTNEVFYAPRFKELVGFSDREFPNLFSSFAARLHPEDQQRVTAAVDAHLRMRQPYDVEYRLRLKSGAYRWFRARGQAIWDDTGKATRMAGSITDVTDRKEMELTLKHEQFLLETLLENLPDAIYFKDVEGRFLRVSAFLARHLGALEAEEIVGKTDADFFPADYAAQARVDEEAILHSGQSITSKEESPHWANGTDSWVLTTKIPLRDENGKIIGSFGISRDITAVKQAEQRFRIVVDATPNPIVVVDASGEIVLANRATEAVFGYSREEVIGQPIEMLVPHSRRAIQSPQRYPVGKGLSLFGRRRDGTDFPVDFGLSPILVEGEQLVLGSVIDLTTVKEAEQALIHAKDAAEAANRAKSDFLANMSHEIRTPMNAIIGMTELVLDTSLSPTQKDYLTIVLESADSLLSIINQILDFSKIEAGKLELEQTDFDLREEVGDAMKSLALRAHSKGLELAWQVRGDVPQRLRGDPVRLRQMLVNLTGNAIKFTNTGEVIVDVRMEAVQEEEVKLHFIVRDTGIGIPQNKLEAVFLAFEQADSSTTRQFGGTGLGLAITSRIAEAMGGRTWVESELGQGSTFHFTVTLRKGEPSPSVSKTTSTDLQHTPVVVVDDNATNRTILKETLESWGMQVYSVSGGREAIQVLQEIAARHPVSPLLISDVNMPEIDGFSLVEQVRSVTTLRETSIILLTSGGRPGDIARCERLGVCAHMMKPVKQSELFNAVMQAVGCQRQVASPQTPHTELPPIRPLRILLAEDGKANQALAVALLEKWGHDVVVAENGKLAIDQWESQPFDLILMDVQMPVLDGFEATQRIRQAELNTGRHIPIVAMTARAMTGDREKCLEAGMDGYVSKPVRRDDLYQSIASFFIQTPPPSGSEKTPAASHQIVDWNQAFANVDHDQQLLNSVVAACQEELPQLLEGLTAAVARGDLKEARRFAHTVKSSGRMFASTEMTAAADLVEAMAAVGNLSAAAEQLPTLRGCAERFLAELEIHASTS